MYLEKINIKKFRVLEDIEVRFQSPNGATADATTGNVVNVIAGVNGCGKTSLLESVFQGLSNPADFFHTKKSGCFLIRDLLPRMLFTDADTPDAINEDKWSDLYNFSYELNQKYQNNLSFMGEPRLIFLPSQQSFSYSSVTQLQITYQFAQKIDTTRILGNAEFYIKEYILGLERKSTISDPQARTKAAVDAFNAHFLDAKLLTQLVDLSKKQFNRPVFRNVANEEVTIDQLSDGEKQLYARVIALMMLDPQNSIILIDEPEIALHPAWQQKIMQIYSKIGRNNQFIIATHSPQIIANTPYQNLILLHKQDHKIVPLYPSHPPSGVDVNSILSEMMGVEQFLPPDVLELREQYRHLIEQKLENSPEAETVKQKLLQRESNDSKFMQEMRFLLRLRGGQ